MAAVDQDARDALAHVVTETAKLADVETARLVIEVQNFIHISLYLI